MYIAPSYCCLAVLRGSEGGIAKESQERSRRAPSQVPHLLRQRFDRERHRLPCWRCCNLCGSRTLPSYRWMPVCVPEVHEEARAGGEVQLSLRAQEED